MTEHLEIQKRVERLINGGRHPRDVHRIFTWLRFRSHGLRSVREIGDFVAHSEIRDRGVAWKGIRSISRIFDYYMPRIHAHKRAPPPPSSKETAERAALAGLELHRPHDVEKTWGVRKDEVVRTLKRAFGKVDSYDGISFKISQPFTVAEINTLKFYTTAMIVEPMFTDEDLFGDLQQCLIKNGIIETSCESRLQNAKQFITICVIEVMHLSRLQLDSGDIATLQAGIDASNPFNLHVTAVISAPYGDKYVPFVIPVFVTSCHPAIWCDKVLLQEQPPLSWCVPLEVGLDGKLSPLP